MAFERQADALPLEVDLEHLDLDLVADRDHRGRVVDVLPGQLGDVDESVHAAQVDEGAEVDDRGHDALADLARLEVLEELLPLLLLRLLQPGPPAQHHVVAVLVELDDLGFESPADVGQQVTDPSESTRQAGRKPRRPMSRIRPPLTTSMTGPDDAVLLLDPLDRAPRPLVLGPLLGQDQPPFLVLLLEDEGLDLLAEGDDFAGVDVVADGQLTGRDNSLGLVADVEEDLVLVDLHDRASDDVAVVELDDRAGDGILEGDPVVVADDLPEDVLTSVISRHVIVNQGRGACGGGGLVGHGSGGPLSGSWVRTREASPGAARLG